MVESLGELNKICQKPDYKKVGNWMVRKFLRDAALPATWLLLHTPVTANQVTFISLVLGTAGVICLAHPGAGWFIAGVLLLQCWYYLDHVDGQIARYRKTASLTGRFFDFVTHFWIHGILFFALGVYEYQVVKNPAVLFWAFIVSMAMMHYNLISHVKGLVFYERIRGLSGRQIRVAEPQPVPRTFSRPEVHPRKIFSGLAKVCEIHVVMNILTLAAIIEIFLDGSLGFRSPLFWFYGFVVPVMSLVKNMYLIQGQKIDNEYHSVFTENVSDMSKGGSS